MAGIGKEAAMRKHILLVKLPILSTGALIGCGAEILQLPPALSVALVILSQLLLTSLWVLLGS
jgi:hypothetical protein